MPDSDSSDLFGSRVGSPSDFDSGLNFLSWRRLRQRKIARPMMISVPTAAPTAIPAFAPVERVEAEREEETGVNPEVEAGLAVVGAVSWVALKETGKDDLLVLVEADAEPDVAEPLDFAVVLDGAEIVVNAENAPRVIRGVLLQSQL